MVWRKDAFVTADISNSGTSTRVVQLLNMLWKVVTDDVLNAGIWIISEQPKNIELIFVTLEVSKNGTNVSDLQL